MSNEKIVPTGGIFMDMSQGDLLRQLDNPGSLSEGSDSDSMTRKNPLQNLEDFEKKALQDETQSIPVNSIPADNIMNMGSSHKLKEFNLPHGSFAYPDKHKLDQYGSLNSDSFKLNCPEPMNSLQTSNVK